MTRAVSQVTFETKYIEKIYIDESSEHSLFEKESITVISVDREISVVTISSEEFSGTYEMVLVEASCNYESLYVQGVISIDNRPYMISFEGGFRTVSLEPVTKSPHNKLIFFNYCREECK